MTGKSCSTFYPRMQCMAKVSEMYVRHRGTALLRTVGPTMCDDLRTAFAILTAEKSWKHFKLSWKRHGIVMELYYQISVGTLITAIANRTLAFVRCILYSCPSILLKNLPTQLLFVHFLNSRHPHGTPTPRHS